MKRWFIILVVVALAVLFARGPYSEVGGGPGEYVVRPGDTLAEIAARYGVTVDDLVALNRDRYPSLVERPDRIEVGWRLRVPGRGERGALAEVREKAERAAAHINALAATAVAPGQQQPTPAPKVLSVEINDHSNDPREIERRIFELTNRVRAEHGLAPLRWDEELAEIARWRAEDMVKRGYFSHYDPVDGTMLFLTRCSSCSENIATGIPSGSSFVATWLGSPGHRANMLNPRWTAIGVGVEVTGFHAIGVQVFR